MVLTWMGTTAQSSHMALSSQAEPDLPVPFAIPAFQRMLEDQSIQTPNPF